MALKLGLQVKIGSKLPLISAEDSAINWEASYPEAKILKAEIDEKGEEVFTESFSEDVARDRYFDEGNPAPKLVFKEGEIPTVFWFKDPKLAESRALLTDSFTASAARSKDLKLGTATDKFLMDMYIGVSEGLLQEPTKKYQRDLIQVLHDAGIYNEISSALLGAAERSDTKKKSTVLS